MDGINPVSTKLTVRVTKIKADGSREDMGELLLTPTDESKEPEWQEQ